MTPIPLATLLATDPLAAWRAAMVTRIGALLPGVTVVPHLGKLDMGDVIAKAVVAAPGIAIGWTRMRAARELDGSMALHAEWAAYIVAEDKVVADRRVEREVVGLAIGRRLLDILADPDGQTWGRGNILPPAADPRPQLVPMFTVRDATQGAAYYAVTWTQVLIDQGESLFAASVPALSPVDGEATEADFDFGDAAIPLEVLALLPEDGDE